MDFLSFNPLLCFVDNIFFLILIIEALIDVANWTNRCLLQPMCMCVWYASIYKLWYINCLLPFLFLFLRISSCWSEWENGKRGSERELSYLAVYKPKQVSQSVSDHETKMMLLVLIWKRTCPFERVRLQMFNS